MGQLGGRDEEVVDESTTGKTTREQAVSDLVRLGEILARHSGPIGNLGLSRPLRPEESIAIKAEVAELERRIEARAYDRTDQTLRRILELRKDEVLDPILLRCVATVAYFILDSGRSRPTVAAISKAAGLGDWGKTLSARHSIRQAVIKGNAFCFSDCEYGDGVLKAGRDLVKFLSGENRLPIVWSEETLKQEAEEGQRRKDAQTSRPKPCLRHSEPPPSAPKPNESPNLLTAKGIYDSLKDEVIALDGPLRRFSGQMSLHMRRLEQIRKGVRPSVGPIVTLLVGSSGSGKTWMAENFARISGLPYAVADMSGVSQAAYVGLSVDECFYGLLANKTRQSEAQKGIVVLDEFDKLCAKGGGSHSTSDPQGRGIQAELLKPLEGCKLPLGSRRSNSPSFGVLDTFETCFVLAGAFDGLREQIRDGNRKSAGLGFGSAAAKAPRSDIREALVKYGFMAQIVNRIGAIIVLPDPTPDQIVRITTHPGTGLLARWNAFGSTFGTTLDLTNEAIQYLAQWACETKGYSRAVKTLLGTLVEQHLYDEKADVINIWQADVKRAIEETEGAEGLQK